MVKNQKGSTLLLTVIAMLLMSVLGTALLSMTTMNVGMKQSDKALKSAYYYTESGIEEAYTMTAQAVEECLIAAKTSTVNSAAEFVNGIEKTVSAMKRAQENPLDSSVNDEIEEKYKQYINMDFSIKDEDVNNVIKEMYTDEIQTKWQSQINSLIEKLKNPEEYKLKTPLSINAEVLPDTEVYGDNLDQEFSDKTTIKVTSQYEYNGADRIISAEIEVKMPDSIDDLISIKQVPRMENVLWKYALAAQDNIIVTGEDVTVKGNIYAYGTRPEDTTQLSQFGGLTVNKDAKLTVNGDVITHSFVQTKDNGELNIKNSNVYCNSLVIQEQDSVSGNSKNQNNKRGASINITDSYVYTEDDIEHNGTDSDLTLDGVYIGFSNGSTSGGTHDKSSSIVINSPDIDKLQDAEGTESTLAITGEKPEEDKVLQGGYTHIQHPNHFDDEGSQNISILVPGTVTVFGKNGNRYQTGESVSIKGNYLAYTYFDAISEIDEDSATDSNGVEEGNPIKENELDGLTLIPGTVEEKDNHINNFYDNYYSQDTSAYMPFYLGDKGLNINLGNYWYTLGSRLGHDGNGKWDIQRASEGNTEGYTEQVGSIIEAVKRDYTYLLNYLRYRTKENDGVTEEITGLTPIANYIKTGASMQFPSKQSNVNNEVENQVILKYYDNSDKTTPISIKEFNGYTGIIVSEKDIVIPAPFTFSGAIITKGNIIIEGKGEVNLYNNNSIQKEISQLVNQYTDFQNVFQNSESYTEQVYMSIEDVLSVDYKNLVKIGNWKQGS